MDRNFFQRSVYFSPDQMQVVNSYFESHDFETFSGLMKRLLFEHIQQQEPIQCVSGAPISTIP